MINGNKPTSHIKEVYKLLQKAISNNDVAMATPLIQNLGNSKEEIRLLQHALHESASDASIDVYVFILNDRQHKLDTIMQSISNAFRYNQISVINHFLDSSYLEKEKKQTILENILALSIEHKEMDLTTLLLANKSIDPGRGLYNAVKRNDFKLVKLIANHPRYNASLHQLCGKDSPESILEACIKYGSLEILTYLIKTLKFDPDNLNSRNLSALHIACVFQNKPMVEFLIAHSNMFSMNDSFQACVKIDDFEMLNMIGENKPELYYDVESLQLAVKRGSLKVLMLLLECHNENEMYDPFDDEGLFFSAIKHGQEDCAHLLLNNTEQSKANNYLVEAVIKRNLLAVTVLLDHDAVYQNVTQMGRLKLSSVQHPSFGHLSEKDIDYLYLHIYKKVVADIIRKRKLGLSDEQNDYKPEPLCPTTFDYPKDKDATTLLKDGTKHNSALIYAKGILFNEFLPQRAFERIARYLPGMRMPSKWVHLNSKRKKMLESLTSIENTQKQVTLKDLALHHNPNNSTMPAAKRSKSA